MRLEITWEHSPVPGEPYRCVGKIQGNYFVESRATPEEAREAVLRRARAWKKAQEVVLPVAEEVEI